MDPIAARALSELVREKLEDGADRIEIERQVRALELNGELDRDLDGREVDVVAIRVSGPGGTAEILALEDVLGEDGYTRELGAMLLERAGAPS